MYRLLLLSILSLSLFSAHAKTYVSQHIKTDITWKKANSPYIVSNDLTIMDTATLTIEAGVLVEFSKDTRILVRGSILALGKRNKKITFKGLNNDSWNGFLFTQSCDNFDPTTQTGCHFDFCSFKGTGISPTHLIRSKGCNVAINNCSIDNCYTAIQSERQAEIWVENNQFKNCNRVLNVKNTSIAHVTYNKMSNCNSIMLGGSTDFSNNILKKFSGRGRHSGIVVWMLGGGIVNIENNDFQKFERYTIKLQKQTKRSTFTVRNNNFKNNETNLKLSCKYYNRGKSTVEQNNFHNYSKYHIQLFSPCSDKGIETLTLGANYWGKIQEAQALDEAILDQRKDNSLAGTVQYSELIKKAIK